MTEIKILLVDDHQIVRKGLNLVLSSEPSFKVVHDCESAELALEYMNNNKVDVLVTDVTMLGMNGIDLVKTVNKNFPIVNKMVLSMHLDESYISDAIEFGAKAYLVKDSSEQDIIKAIKSVNNNELYLTKTVSDILAKSFLNKSKNDNIKKEAKLTKREKEIIKQIVAGLSNKQIGAKLFISDSTVNAHRYNLMKKLKVNNTADLVRITLTHKLID